MNNLSPRFACEPVPNVNANSPCFSVEGAEVAELLFICIIVAIFYP
jgi:hypothetical protein